MPTAMELDGTECDGFTIRFLVGRSIGGPGAIPRRDFRTKRSHSPDLSNPPSPPALTPCPPRPHAPLFDQMGNCRFWLSFSFAAAAAADPLAGARRLWVDGGSMQERKKGVRQVLATICCLALAAAQRSSKSTSGWGMRRNGIVGMDACILPSRSSSSSRR